MKRAMLLLVVLTVLLAACGGGSDDSNQNNAGTGPPASTAHISLLFMGNSHASVNDLQGMIAAMVRAARPAMSVATVEAPGWMFLEERLSDVDSVNLLRSQNWSFRCPAGSEVQHLQPIRVFHR